DDDLGRLQFQLEQALLGRRAELATLERRLASQNPRAVIAGARARLGPLSVRLEAAIRRALADKRRRLPADAGSLDALSPLAVLARGYALAKGPGGRLLHAAAEVSPGDAISIRVARGRIDATVVSTSDRGGGDGDG